MITVAGIAPAQEHSTPAEAQKLVSDAIAHIKQVGAPQAFEDFTAPGGKWHRGELYVFCYKFDGDCLCHGGNKSLVGKNLLNLRYPDGELRNKQMAELAKTKGSGWFEYQWTHPETKKVAIKRAWLMKINDDSYLGVGFYK
jgi:hypothetical protein